MGARPARGDLTLVGVRGGRKARRANGGAEVDEELQRGQLGAEDARGVEGRPAGGDFVDGTEYPDVSVFCGSS